MSEILANLMTVLDEEHARAVVEHRRVTIKKPLTAYGAKRLAARLSEWRDPNAAADTMIDRCWQGFEASWMTSRPQQRTGRRNFADAALDRINGSESVFGGNRDVELVPVGQQQPGSDAGNLRIGFAGAFPASRH